MMSPSEELGYIKRTIREAVFRLRYTSDTPEAIAEYLEDSLSEVVPAPASSGAARVAAAVVEVERNANEPGLTASPHSANNNHRGTA